jgi:hypothetical protein
VPLGLHKAGYTSFALRLDNVPGVQWGGENVLAVYVDATTGTGWWCVVVALYPGFCRVRVSPIGLWWVRRCRFSNDRRFRCYVTSSMR